MSASICLWDKKRNKLADTGLEIAGVKLGSCYSGWGVGEYLTFAEILEGKKIIDTNRFRSLFEKGSDEAKLWDEADIEYMLDFCKEVLKKIHEQKTHLSKITHTHLHGEGPSEKEDYYSFLFGHFAPLHTICKTAKKNNLLITIS